MDPLSIIIVGAVVAAAPVAHGAGVPAPIVEQVVQSARTDLPALTEQLPDPQPYVDRVVAAAEELQAQLPAEVTAQIGDRLPPDVKDAIADVQRQLPIEAQAVVSPALRPPPTAAAPGAEPTTAGSAQFSPGALSPFVPQGVTSVPSPLLVIPGLGGSALPPAVIPGLTLQAIPAAFLPALHSAAGVCPQVGAPVLAAQLWLENGFRYGPAGPVSEAGAMGPAQFMPDTWARWGRDYSGDGVVDPLDVTDAVVSQAHLMCAIVDEVDRGKADGSLVGDTVALALAAYNAGSGALVRNPGGGDSMPSGGDYTTQTRPYVARILAAVPRFAAMLGLTDPAVVRQRYAGAVAGAALAKVGVPYVWGANRAGCVRLLRAHQVRLRGRSADRPAANLAGAVHSRAADHRRRDSARGPAVRELPGRRPASRRDLCRRRHHGRSTPAWATGSGQPGSCRHGRCPLLKRAPDR